MRTSINPRRDPRLAETAMLAAGGIILALLLGELWPAAVGAAAGAVLLVGLRQPSARIVDIDVKFSAERLIEGDRLETSITVTHSKDLDIDIAVPPTTPGSPLGQPQIIDRRQRPQSTTIVVARQADQWGYHRAGTVNVRATSDNSLVYWESKVEDPHGVRVLPTPTRLSELLNPRASQSSAGTHPARIVTGDGAEFVDIREYLPGDRIRDINWKVTARRGLPHTNRRRPERGGDVIIVIDAIPDAGWVNSIVGRQLLLRAGQASWALIRNHLAVQDRVGLLVRRTDGVIHLPQRGGSRAQYQLLDALLSANAKYPSQPVGDYVAEMIPPAALTIVVTSLSNAFSMRSVAALGANGRATGVLALEPDDYLSLAANIDSATARLAAMAFDARVAYIRRIGISVSVWNPRGDLNRAVARLGEMTRRASRRGIA